MIFDVRNQRIALAFRFGKRFDCRYDCGIFHEVFRHFFCCLIVLRKLAAPKPKHQRQQPQRCGNGYEQTERQPPINDKHQSGNEGGDKRCGNNFRLRVGKVKLNLFHVMADNSG